MKKAIILFILSFITLYGADWYDYENAVKLQEKSSKPIMIDIIRTDCRYCIEMDRNVFEDKEMSKWIEERFIPVKINLDIDDIPLGIKASMTPSFYFIDKNQTIIKTIPGSWNIENFKLLIKEIK